MLIFKMSVLKNFLLESMQFWSQNEAGIMHYSSTSDLESNDTKSDTVSYRCGSIEVRYPLSGRYYSCCRSFESPFRVECHTEDRLKNGSEIGKL